MTNTHGHPDDSNYDRLRRNARDLIDHGVPPQSRGGTLSVDALQLLYERASKPESAADAFKLLHELQTYQVELDLLYEQLQANELELNEELEHYKFLYEQAPAAYLIVANDGEIIEGNQAASELFGQSVAELPGKALNGLLAKGQDHRVTSLIREGREQKAILAVFDLPDQRRVSISAKSAAAGDGILMVVTKTTAPAITT